MSDGNRTVSQPHDKFFKDTFSRPEVIRDFLRTYLPKIAELADLRSLELTKDSFVDKELRDHFSDLIWKVRLRKGKKEAFFYFLLEHKSYADYLVAFQVLRYMVMIWEQAVRKHEEERKKRKKEGRNSPRLRLPPVIPVVIYHGRTTWNISRNFRSLFDMHQELEDCIPDFRYLLYDISHRSDDRITGGDMLRAGLLIMKYIFREELAERLPGILAPLRRITKEQAGLEFLETIATYLVKGTDKVSEKALAEAVKSALPETGGEFMATLAEKWVEQGKKEGRKEGLLDGIETGLELKFGSEGLRLLPEIQKITDCDMLTSVSRGLWTVKNLDEFRKIYH